MNETTSDVEGSKPCRKTRRPHTKSRYGCTKCKQRRIKCDELMPRCSRCTKMNLICQYRRPKECWDEIDSGMGSTDAESPPSATPNVGSSYGLSLDSSALLQSSAALSLVPAEFELLRHYLEHTSLDATVDEEEQYTLQVGIPALACQSKPLMSSVLALAAVCKCHDIINQPAVNNHEARNQVLQLLSVANEYHAESLHEIQGALHETEKYDHILANAAMMGMYGSGSHCARIWLAKMAGQSEVAPGCPQWISLFRAARLAFAGLFYDDSEYTSETDHAFSPRQYGYHTPSHTSTSGLSSPANHHPLGPIVAATVGSALARLHQSTEAILALEPLHEDAQACSTALSILSDIVAATFPGANPNPSPSPTLSDPRRPTSSSSPESINTLIDPELLSPGTASRSGTVTEPRTSHNRSQSRNQTRLAQVSPWLRRYTARIASMAPSQLPRRTIMAFVHKVPGRYLSLLEEVLTTTTRCEGADVMDLTGSDEDWLGRDGGSGIEEGQQRQPSVAVRHLALEVFAHWLVLVLLLDDVWWIGGIGAWELGRVVALRKDGVWPSCLGDGDGEGDWWPGSMWEISRLREKYK